MTRPPRSIHGTRRGYFKHRRSGQDACLPCAVANAAYMREYREKHPEYQKGLNRLRTIRRDRLRCIRGLGWPLAPEGWWAE